MIQDLNQVKQQHPQMAPNIDPRLALKIREYKETGILDNKDRSKFVLFQSLPIEVRLIILGFALDNEPQLRVQDVSLCPERYYEAYKHRKLRIESFPTVESWNPSPLLSVSVEARNFTLSQYTGAHNICNCKERENSLSMYPGHPKLCKDSVPGASESPHCDGQRYFVRDQLFYIRRPWVLLREHIMPHREEERPDDLPAGSFNALTFNHAASSSLATLHNPLPLPQLPSDPRITTEDLATVAADIWHWANKIENLAIHVEALLEITSQAFKEVLSTKLPHLKRLTILYDDPTIGPPETWPDSPGFASWCEDMEKTVCLGDSSKEDLRLRQISALKNATVGDPELWWGKLEGVEMRILVVCYETQMNDIEHEDFWDILIREELGFYPDLGDT